MGFQMEFDFCIHFRIIWIMYKNGNAIKFAQTSAYFVPTEVMQTLISRIHQISKNFQELQATKQERTIVFFQFNDHFGDISD